VKIHVKLCGFFIILHESSRTAAAADDGGRRRGQRMHSDSRPAVCIDKRGMVHG